MLIIMYVVMSRPPLCCEPKTSDMTRKNTAGKPIATTRNPIDLDSTLSSVTTSVPTRSHPFLHGLVGGERDEGVLEGHGGDGDVAGLREVRQQGPQRDVGVEGVQRHQPAALLDQVDAGQIAEPYRIGPFDGGGD